MSRLPEETPVRKAFKEATRPVKKPCCGQKQTWPKLIEKDLKGVNMNLDSAAIYAQSRPQWQSMTNRIMSELSDSRCE